MKKSSDGGLNILRAAALVLGGAAAWIILSSSQAGAIAIVDQESSTTNGGIAISNTGVNGAVGNSSRNTATTNQDATAFGGFLGGGDTVAVNSASGGNHSSGTASIHTGNATAVGSHSVNHNVQVIDTGDSWLTVADQTNSVRNSGFAFATSGFNFGVGNSSTSNNANVNQNAVAFGGFFGDDVVAVNDSSAVNHSTGSAHISTGSANATGSTAHNTNTQVLNTASGHSGFNPHPSFNPHHRPLCGWHSSWWGFRCAGWASRWH